MGYPYLYIKSTTYCCLIYILDKMCKCWAYKLKCVHIYIINNKHLVSGRHKWINLYVLYLLSQQTTEINNTTWQLDSYQLIFISLSFSQRLLSLIYRMLHTLCNNSSILYNCIFMLVTSKYKTSIWTLSACTSCPRKLQNFGAFLPSRLADFCFENKQVQFLPINASTILTASRWLVQKYKRF